MGGIVLFLLFLVREGREKREREKRISAASDGEPGQHPYRLIGRQVTLILLEFQVLRMGSPGDDCGCHEDQPH